MATEAKIVTLYQGVQGVSNIQQAIAPRTKVSAISDENGVGLDVTLEKINNIFNLIYPVGSIYMSANSTSPELLFDETTWIEVNDSGLSFYAWKRTA